MIKKIGQKSRKIFSRDNRGAYFRPIFEWFCGGNGGGAVTMVRQMQGMAILQVLSHDATVRHVARNQQNKAIVACCNSAT